MKIMFTCEKDSIISEMIQFFTGQDAKIHPIASHCLPIIGELEKIEFGLSADELLVCLVDVNRYRVNPKVAYRIYELPNVVDQSIWVKRLIDEANEKIYPHFELVYFIWKWLKGLVVTEDPTDKNWIDYSYFCSELTAHAMQAAGFSGWIKGIDANSISPTELENYVATLPGVKLIEEVIPNEKD